MANDRPAHEFKERDIYILRELAKDPSVSSRDLSEILAADYDIDVSYVTVNESIRNMREAGVFREAIVPNEEYFVFELFEFKFNPEYFAEEWRGRWSTSATTSIPSSTSSLTASTSGRPSCCSRRGNTASGGSTSSTRTTGRRC